MFKFLKSILGKSNREVTQPIVKRVEDESIGQQKAFKKHLDLSPLIKPECHAIVLKHLSNEVNLNKSGEKLTTDQKRALGLNTRLSITTSLVEVLTDEGLALKDPKEALKIIFYRATFEVYRLRDIHQMKSAGIKQYTFESVKDECDCEWCKSMHGRKLNVSTDINGLIIENCKCSWCRSFLSPIIKF